MKKTKSALLLAAACTGIAAIAVACKVTTPDSVEVTIFHTNDIHSHMRAAKVDPFGLGGLARLSTLLTQLRKTSPNSLTLDAGDFSEGTLYFNVDTGANMLKALTMMGYDAACLGNHDFLVGPDQLLHTIQSAQASFPVLASNLDMTNYPQSADLLKALPPTTIKQVGNLKVGIIGLTTFEPLYDSYIAPVQITNSIDAATRYANQLRPNVDVLVVVSHNAFEANMQIAKAVPGVDAVISGHSHLKVPQVVLVKNAGRDVPVVETGAWGKFLGDLKLTVTPSNKTVAYKSYQLHPVSPDLVEEPTMAAFVNQQELALNTQYGDDINRVVAEADTGIDQADAYESTMGNLAVKSYLAATGADVAMEEISLTGVSIAPGPVTFMDLHDVVPHIFDAKTGKEWMLRVWNAKGSDLQLAINIFYTIDGLVPLSSPLGWLSVENAVVTWDPGALKPAVSSITIGGKPLDPSARYKVALSDGLLLALTLVNQKLGLGVDLSDMQNSGIEAWRSVVNYAAQAHKLTLQDLAVGGHTHTQSADLAIFDYAMDWDGSQISVDVQNQGLSASTAATLTCSSGVANDILLYGTTYQKWTSIGTASVPVLKAGETTTVQVAWSSKGLAKGFWPVQCALSGAKDAYPANDGAGKIFRVTQ